MALLHCLHDMFNSFLLLFAVFSDVAVFGDTNLELPSVLSNLSVVEIHKGIDLNILSHNKNLLDFTIDLPLHSRYPVSLKYLLESS